MQQTLGIQWWDFALIASTLTIQFHLYLKSRKICLKLLAEITLAQWTDVMKKALISEGL